LDDIRLSLGNDDKVAIVIEGRKYLKKLLDSGIPKSAISLTGHSLGGYAAIELSEDFQLKSFVFNAAASVFSPRIKGPGPLLSTAYHIVGDGISSHMADNTSRTVRAFKNTTFLQTGFNHALSKFDQNDPTFGLWGTAKENALFIRFLKVATIPGVAAE
jgi:malonyl CoA-acyl carrier protein transacylase